MHAARGGIGVGILVEKKRGLAPPALQPPPPST